MKLKLDGKFLACQIVLVALLAMVTTTVFGKGIKSKEDLGLALQNEVLCKEGGITGGVSIEEEHRRGKSSLDDVIRSVSLKPSTLKDLTRLGVKVTGNRKVHDDSESFNVNLEFPSGVRVWGYEVKKVVIAKQDVGSQESEQSTVTIQATAADMKILKNRLRLKPPPKGQPAEDNDYGSMRYFRIITYKDSYDSNTIFLGLPKHADGAHVVIGCEYISAMD